MWFDLQSSRKLAKNDRKYFMPSCCKVETCCTRFWFNFRDLASLSSPRRPNSRSTWATWIKIWLYCEYINKWKMTFTSSSSSLTCCNLVWMAAGLSLLLDGLFKLFCRFSTWNRIEKYSCSFNLEWIGHFLFYLSMLGRYFSWWLKIALLARLLICETRSPGISSNFFMCPSNHFLVIAKK